MESKKSKDKLDDHMIRLRLRLFEDDSTASLSPSVLSPPPQIETYHIMSLSKRKRYAMFSNLNANLKADVSRNPTNYPPNTSSIFHSAILDLCANKIQRPIRNRNIKCSDKQAKEAMRNQTHRVNLIQYLSKFISTNTCDKLLLGSEDPGIMKSFSPFDRRHVQIN